LSNRMATAVLADINEKIDAQIKSITVEKIIDPLFDLKDLAVFDNNPTQCKLAESDRLDQLARDNAQLIFNQLFDRKQLERTVIDDAIVVTLPDKTKTGPFACPREKPLPKKKPQTKWEAFAAVKGINAKKKKSRMVWCEVTKSWKPRWGYMSAKKLADVNKNGETKDWVREMRPGDDMEVDPWTKEQRDKKERVAKNEHARLKNVARNTPKLKKESKDELRTSFRRAKVSTASMGNFDKQVEGEKKERIGGKRKYEPMFNKNETSNSLQLLDVMSAKNPKLNVQAASDKIVDMDPKARKGKKGGKSAKQGKQGKRKAKSS